MNVSGSRLKKQLHDVPHHFTGTVIYIGFQLADGVPFPCLTAYEHGPEKTRPLIAAFARTHACPEYCKGFGQGICRFHRGDNGGARRGYQFSLHIGDLKL